MSTPFDAATFCSDEDLAIEATGDIARLAPRGVLYAQGADGSLSGWTLASASVDFAAQQVPAGALCVLSGLGGSAASVAIGFGGEVFVVSTPPVGGSLPLRAVGLDAGVGQPPPQVTARFALPSFELVRKQSSDRIRRLIDFDLDADLIDLDDLRQACVYHVLATRFRAVTRQKDDEFAYQAQKYSALYERTVEELKARRQSNYATDAIPVVPVD